MSTKTLQLIEEILLELPESEVEIFLQKFYKDYQTRKNISKNSTTTTGKYVSKVTNNLTNFGPEESLDTVDTLGWKDAINKAIPKSKVYKRPSKATIAKYTRKSKD